MTARDTAPLPTSDDQPALSRRNLSVAAGTALAAALVGVGAPAEATPTGQGQDQGQGHGQGRGKGRCPDITEGGLLTPKSDLVRAQAAAIDRLAYLVGTWDGTGYQVGEDGVRTDFRQVEQVDRYLAGQLLTVQGRSTALTRPYAAQFRAFATLGFDPTADRYLWTPFTDMASAPAPIPFEVTADGWAWEIPLGGPAKVRYEATFSGPGQRQWDEIGYFTDGVNRVEVFGLTVRRCRS